MLKNIIRNNLLKNGAQLAERGATEYTDSSLKRVKTLTMSVLDMTLNNLIMRLQ